VAFGQKGLLSLAWEGTLGLFLRIAAVLVVLVEPLVVALGRSVGVVALSF
jgi:hypothetical protein